ncbi:MAG: hypothetical protein AAB692_00635, partial [Patescibacteria group bacterium]
SDFSPAGQQSQATSINADKNLGATTVSGTLSVSLADTNPKPTTFVGGIGASMLEIAVKNTGSTAAKVDSLTLQRVGNGALADIFGVYLYHGADRLGSMRTFNASSHRADFSGVDLAIAAGATEVISVIVTFNQTMGASDQHALRLIDLKSGSAQAGGLPLIGSTFTMSSVNSGAMTVLKSGSSPLTNIRAGGLAQKIGEFRLAVDSVEDMDFVGIALTRGGAVDRSKLSNLVLKAGGQTVATVAGYDRYDRATFSLAAPVLVEKGSSRTFEVFADIAGGTRGGATETVFTYVDDTVDVTAIGHVYGFASLILTATAYGGSYDGVSCALGAGNCSSTRIEAGQLTLTFNGPAVKDVAA